MSTFRRLCTATKRTAKQVVDKAESLADSAVTAVKIKNLEMKIDEKYEELGRLIYRDLHIDESLEEQKLALIAEIDGLYYAIDSLKAQSCDKEQEEAPDPDQSAE